VNPPPSVTRWLVCRAFGDGCQAPSNLRHCGGHTGRGCGRQVWVSLAMDALVQSGELVPRCWDCQVRAGGSVSIHVVEDDRLAASGDLIRGWDFIAQANAW